MVLCVQQVQAMVVGLLVLTGSSTAQQCNVSANMVIGTGTLKALTVPDAAQCCTACYDFGYTCAAFTFESTVSSSATGNCFLKDNTGGKVAKSGATSGTTGSGPSPPSAKNRTVATRACIPPFGSKPWCDTSKSIDDRVTALIAEIQDDEIAPLLTAREGGGDSPGPSGAIERLGLPEYDWGVNCIHGVQTTCAVDDAGVTHCPTSFPNPVSLGAAWNASMYHEMGAIIGTELRALWLDGETEASPWSGKPHAGLDCWSPNINLNRDPRWGRNQEVASEDPYLNGVFGTQYTLGLQEGDDPRFTQVIVTLKHWDAYSLENSDGFTRHNFNALIDNATLADTYFPAFKMTVQEGKALGVMCSYNSINGVPTCANSMLNTVLRENWGFDGYITSDTGAIEDIYSAHHYAKNASDATAKAIHDGGCDIDSGGVYHNGLLDAVQEGLLSRADMILSLHRTLKLRFRLGLFDPIEDQPYWAVPIDVVGSDAHQATNLLATLESMVLLKNDGNVLPISPTAKVALIGPHANATEALVGNYLGQLCKGGLSDFSCVQSVASGIAAEFSALTITPGCTITTEIDGGVAAAVAAAKDADVVILAIGIDGALEGESHDRTDTALPTPQQALAAAIAATGKPTVVVLINGGMVNLEAIKADHAAILSTGYPGYFGAKAIASTLVGDNDHLGGKLPYTVYPADYIQSVKMSDMSMRPSANSPGRSYRWYTGQPVFPFGTGMSLTTFRVTNTSSFCGGSNAVEIADGLATMSYEVTVTNTGTRAGDEVIFGFFTPPQSSVMRQIFGFQRVHLEPGASETVVINATAASFAVAADNGDLVTEHGPYQITLSNGMLEEVKCAVTFSEGAKVVAPFPGHQM